MTTDKTDDDEKVQTMTRSGGELRSEAQPIVLDYKKHKKKKATSDDTGKARYSAGLKDLQNLEGNVMRVTQKASRAITKGIDSYEHERQQSAKAKKDGAVEDFFHNTAKASSTFLKEASDIPVDLADAVNTKSYRKRLRKGLRRASRVIRMWRI